MIDWLNQNNGFLMALLTFVYVISTIVLCFYASRSNHLAKQLHEDIYRPVIVCDFFTENTIVYFRVKNFGNQTGKNIRISATGPQPQLLKNWEDHSIVKNGISFLSPGAEMVSFFAGPARRDFFSTVIFNVTYQDSVNRQYNEVCSINFEAWLNEDLGRQNNAPIIRALNDIKKAIGSS